MDFNEDLSAFHGPTLESQIAYTTKAISYILSLYPENTQILVLGHSMGGIVAASLLPSPNISAIITMSSPSNLAPVRFDSRIDRLYDKLKETLEHDETPILALCGGAKDLMISSESCILPKAANGAFRRTVFSSALEGSWSGVGHQEMVWCHQVRWRIARALLEMGKAATNAARGQVLDRWLRDGNLLPPFPLPYQEELNPTDLTSANIQETDTTSRLVSPRGSKVTLLPVRNDGSSQRITVVVAQGSISGVSPQNPIPLRVSVFLCEGERPTAALCSTLSPDVLRLIPSPGLGSIFPVPGEGSDESDGVVLFEALLPSSVRKSTWVVVKSTSGDGRGWVVADLNHTPPTVVETSTWCK